MAFINECYPIPFLLPKDPKRIALLMIDFQGDFCDPERSYLAAKGVGEGTKHTLGVLETARTVLVESRVAGLRVIHTIEAHRSDGGDLPPSKDRRSRAQTDREVPVIGRDFGNGRVLTRGSKCNSLMPQVAFRDGEVAIHKPGKGAFFDTELEARLQYYGVTHLIVTGVTTECCVQATVREANDRGYDVVVVEDATASTVPSMKTETLRQLTAFGAICACSATSQNIVKALRDITAAADSVTVTIPATIDSLSLSTDNNDNNDNNANPLPVIDVSVLVERLNEPFAVARRNVNSECLRVAKQIDEACRRIGFFYVKGHGLTPPLDRARQFFALPMDEKLKLTADAGEGAGYEASGAQVLDEGRLGDGVDGEVTKLGDVKESYIVGKSVPSQRVDHTDRIEGRWPSEEDTNYGENPNATATATPLKGFRDELVAYHDDAERLQRTLLRGVALGLGLAADTFDPFTTDAMTKVRLLRYPPSNPQGYDGGAFGCGAHTDWGALTLLAQDSIGGLEVCFESASSGKMEWVPVPNVEGALLINVGDMLKLWTMGRYQSAPHRVVKPLKAQQERHSVAFFFNCDHDAPIDPRLLFPNKEMDKTCNYSANLTAEQYILERVKETYSQ